jgi:uncharacterized protein YndB with AHSA1/START domain
MRSPEGIDYPLKGVFRAIAPPERLVITMDCSEHPPEWQDLVDPRRASGNNDPVGEMLMTVTFLKQAGRTLLSIRIRFRSTANRDVMVKIGMNEGWSQSLDRLATLLSVT